ncbi:MULTISPECIES: helix-turn-helix domain-containing protein [Bacillus]|uniref:helix-turn-helix domain-containing protein n=1 Tax=Bacillus TaxID=1386 RepID=UPI0005D37B07|nr:helix-turn-helix transcriptional regulator [Bacillus altitudinis]KQL39148.1 XRE family transcriptional regulator [Bacillus sp. FJAT-21955]KJF45934.1 XRE family transcriptional regulator [Bacillus altitudinis]MBU8654465.1 helix-turn-helix transcriptional regulator [Bacillus altitudinis]MBU8779934.1 helix-turn-helix transcriptional regulator [Bacillus altitudinis]NMF14983.1 helix-turn-helix transcriptional regulator [Bacillus altitudinis]
MRLRPSYKPMEITLIRKDKKKSDLRNDTDISSATLAKMSKGEIISLGVIIKICEYLECEIHDVVELEEIKEDS